MDKNLLSIRKKSENLYVVTDHNGKEFYENSSYKNCLTYISENSNIEKPSFYVIKDLMTWATNARERSELVRFETLEEALSVFKDYRKENYNREHLISNEGLEYARLTLGAKIGSHEIDVVHVRDNKNYLVQDFQLISAFNSNIHFIEAINIINREIGLDYINVYRHPSKDEILSEIYRIGKLNGLSEVEIRNGIERNTIPKNWIPQLVKEEQKISTWENCYLDVIPQEQKYFIDGKLSLVTHLRPGNIVTLKSGSSLLIGRIQPLTENEKMVGKSITHLGKEVTFSYQEIKKLVANMQEIKPKTLSEKIEETKKIIDKVKGTIEYLEKGPSKKTTVSDLDYEKRLLHRFETNLEILEEYKKNPEKLYARSEKTRDSVLERMEQKGYKYDEVSSTSGYLVFSGSSGQVVFEDWDKVSLWAQKTPNIKDSDMEYIKTLAEKVYVFEKGTLDSGFEDYMEDIKNEIRNKGYNAVAGQLKDVIKDIERESMRDKPMDILKR